jgi:hypothetical protein
VTGPRIRPRNGSLYVVRWLRTYDQREAQHRYYRRRTDAAAFADHLAARGIDSRTYRTRVRWTETTP